MIKTRKIIMKPLLTEKMSHLEESERKYAFQVNPDSNKIDVKKAVEKKFDVKVSKVTTMNFQGKNKQLTMRSGGRPIRTSGRRSNWKKAIVTLQDGYTIDLFGMEAES